ncbi:STAS domain-containing protein [Streptomyces sp. CRN 30]|uniref:STAS domain-containing protein n=1 Tax=Streptomyces sp. CRN 30 TaxID=3075613 RepID=UPI002A810D85|nr:STAS domain-containing protein [Streptomyces sp. CRN 30]
MSAGIEFPEGTGCVLVRFVGAIDADEIPRVSEQVLHGTSRSVLLADLTEAEPVFGRSFFALLTLALKTRAAGVKLLVVGPDHDLERLIATTATGRFLPCYATVGAALHSTHCATRAAQAGNQH